MHAEARVAPLGSIDPFCQANRKKKTHQTTFLGVGGNAQPQGCTPASSTKGGGLGGGDVGRSARVHTPLGLLNHSNPDRKPLKGSLHSTRGLPLTTNPQVSWANPTGRDIIGSNPSHLFFQGFDDDRESESSACLRCHRRSRGRTIYSLLSRQWLSYE